MMGLFLDRPAHMIDQKGFSACNNVRIELGRVRSDLMGWTLASYLNLGQPVVYLDSFTNVLGQTIQIAVTPTDILKLNVGGAGHTYLTPCWAQGTVNVTNGSLLVDGTPAYGNSTTWFFWQLDIQQGDSFSTTGTVSAGATSIALTGQSAQNFQYLGGCALTDTTNTLALTPGTYITYNWYDSATTTTTIGLSAPVVQNIPNTDNLVVGNLLLMRQNVRVGDQIAFGTTSPGVTGSGSLTWYTVTGFANSGNDIQLDRPYAGVTASGVSYVVRQILTNTLPGSLPECSSDSYLQAGGFGGFDGFFNQTTAPTIPTQGGDMWFFTNKTDPVVVYYDNLKTCRYSRTVPFFAGCLKTYKGVVVYGNLFQPLGSTTNPTLGFTLPTSISSSDDGFPQQMNSGVAFEGIVTGGPFHIARIAILGSTLLMYSIGEWTGGFTNSSNMSGVVTSAAFVGFPTIWSFSDIIQTRGPVAGNAVAVFTDRHEFLSIDAQYRYNGLFVQVMNDQVWRPVLKLFDTQRPNACFAFIVPTTGDVVWVTPLTTDPPGQAYASTAFVEHYMEQANSYLFKPYTRRDFPFLTAASFQFSNAQPTYYAGDLNGNIWQLYATNTQGGVPALSTVTWGARKIGNGRSRVLVTRVYPEIEYQASPAGNVSVTLTMQDATAGPVTLTDVQSFNPSYPNGLRFTNHFRRGRVASVTLSDTAGVGWVCDGYDWDWTAGGVR